LNGDLRAKLETAFPFLQTAVEWDDLKHFLAVARSGSLSEAALAIKTSPSTVSRRIGALEKKLGVRLFDHKSSGYSLTESGVDIRQKAEDVEAAVLSVERAALGRDMQATGVVRVTASDDIAANLIAPQLGYFHAPTQGYGEQYLKIPTDGPERANRRVTVRRITPLLTGQAQ
jgi:regulatory helix-turn-helix LysR family protein